MNRWFETPLDHPDYPAVRSYYERLTERYGYTVWGRNGTTLILARRQAG